MKRIARAKDVRHLGSIVPKAVVSRGPGNAMVLLIVKQMKMKNSALVKSLGVVWMNLIAETVSASRRQESVTGIVIVAPGWMKRWKRVVRVVRIISLTAVMARVFLCTQNATHTKIVILD